jgi:UDP-N-acetylglucosamine 1-carboxyvinyltransferase
MDKFRIEGGRRLEGRVTISGSKNASLPAMAAALLTEEPLRLENVPHVHDIITMSKLLAYMGARVETADVHGSAGGKAQSAAMTIEAKQISDAEAPYELVKTMRASILTLGPLMGRFGHARVSLPGGCAIGARPVDLHLKALELMGAQISTEHGYVEARVPEGGRLHGAHIVFDRITVTGTENLMMAAALADGETVMENAAREPEIPDLAELLVKMGAKVEGAGTSTLRVHGVRRLRGATHRIIPDRIEAGTFLVAAAITGGELLIEGCEPAHLSAVIAKLTEAGVEIKVGGANALRVRVAGKLTAASVTTEEYPGFATDMQAQFMALATQAHGVSQIRETIFENRYLHASEMMRMGANIAIDGNVATVTGPTPLSGAPVTASDLRASAGLVLAALVASNTTVIDRVYHIDRGYERIEQKLSGIGASIERVTEGGYPGA